MTKTAVNDPLTIVAMREEDIPNPYVNSEKLSCSECQKAVWVSETILANLPSYPYSIKCLQCVNKQFEQLERKE